MGQINIFCTDEEQESNSVKNNEEYKEIRDI